MLTGEIITMKEQGMVTQLIYENLLIYGQN